MMPEETVHQVAMSHYEIIATIKDYVHPIVKIKLYYNRSGAYIYLGGVIEAKN